MVNITNRIHDFKLKNSEKSQLSPNFFSLLLELVALLFGLQRTYHFCHAVNRFEDSQ